eukprot:GEMP01043789.1.p1 GENE.GEMP01043789.1~~GEMP01043789.1.p1  ORF type:complete len:279 (+),score=70.74 GEMP01043789.1:123-959(+)
MKEDGSSTVHFVPQFLPSDLVTELRLIALATGTPGYRPNVTATTLYCTPPWAIPAQQRARTLIQRKIEDHFNLLMETCVETSVLVNWFPNAYIGRHVDNGQKYLRDRHYTATVWLNDDFDGGEFYFERQTDKSVGEDTEEVEVPFKAGDAVFFPADVPHGVRMVRSGVRQSLIVWFTTNGESCEDHKMTPLLPVCQLTKTQRLCGVGPQEIFGNETLFGALCTVAGVGSAKVSREDVLEALWKKIMGNGGYGSFADFRIVRESEYETLMDSWRQTGFL